MQVLLIVETEEGILNVAGSVTPLNISSSICPTVSGISNVSLNMSETLMPISLKRLKVFQLLTLNPSGSLALSKAFVAVNVTDEGISNCIESIASLKAESSMETKVSGKLKSTLRIAPSNADLPIDVTPFGTSKPNGSSWFLNNSLLIFKIFEGTFKPSPIILSKLSSAFS